MAEEKSHEGSRTASRTPKLWGRNAETAIGGDFLPKTDTVRGPGSVELGDEILIVERRADVLLLTLPLGKMEIGLVHFLVGNQAQEV